MVNLTQHSTINGLPKVKTKRLVSLNDFAKLCMLHLNLFFLGKTFCGLCEDFLIYVK